MKRSVVVVAIILATVAGLTISLGLQRFERTVSDSDVVPTDRKLALLHPMLDGERIVVPADDAPVATSVGKYAAVVVGGRQIGETRRIDLCQQQTNAPAEPTRLYPVLVTGRPDNQPWHNPVILQVAGMPELEISGYAESDWFAAPLTIVATARPASWRVITDRQSDSTTGNQTMHRKAWLLWNDVATPANAPDVGQAFQFAVQIERSPSQDCAAGHLDVRLRSAVGGGTLQALKTVQIFLGDGETLDLKLAPGTHSIPRGNTVALAAQIRPRSLPL